MVGSLADCATSGDSSFSFQQVADGALVIGPDIAT
jgi:hypothetical protein